ncbi:MAG: rhamnulokinase [Tannerellaceae bacterium]|nr:rhamnulokinase [Tannerellaceae bacterium]
MNTKVFLAIDLGATSGRAVIGTINGGELQIMEIHRFPNRILQIHGQYFWNIFSLFEEIKTALVKCRQQGITPQSVGIDTWGVDFGYIAPDGAILGLPRAYRDPYTIGAPEEVFAHIPRNDLYRATGIQIMNFNSLFQIYRARQAKYAPCAAAEHILFMPDLLAYMLTGRQTCEYTIASTSQMLNPYTGTFDDALLKSLNIPVTLPHQPIQPGTIIGAISDDIARETGIAPIPVIAVAGHDTASAVAAVPALQPGFAYLSSGTWSLMGIENSSPIINETTLKHNFTNEGGIENTTRLLKNITGLWLLEECKREWIADGRNYTYPQIVEMAKNAADFPSIINPDDPAFANPQSMTAAITDECKRSNQPVPQTDGDIASIIFHSLAGRYAEVLSLLQDISHTAITCLHIIGGGSQNDYLNTLTAQAIRLPVLAGPAEATAIGNIMIQAKAAGLVADRWEMRQIIARSFPVKTFLP